MVYANQQEYYDAISASTADGQCGLFIDFMLNEILKALKKNLRRRYPKKYPINLSLQYYGCFLIIRI